MPFVPDPELVDLMDQVVAVEVNRNASGATRRAHGSVPPGPWDPMAGMGAVPCHGPCSKTRDVPVLDGLPVSKRFDRWIFASPVALDGRHRLVWLDPDRGRPRYFYLAYETDFPGGLLGNNGQPEYWRADTDEHGIGGLPI